APIAIEPAQLLLIEVTAGASLPLSQKAIVDRQQAQATSLRVNAGIGSAERNRGAKALTIVGGATVLAAKRLLVVPDHIHFAGIIDGQIEIGGFDGQRAKIGRAGQL